MSTITWPASMTPVNFKLSLFVSQRASAAPFGGSEQVVDMLNDRWQISLTLQSRKHVSAAAVEAFINAMRGMSNTVALYHFARKTPFGTLSGSPTAQAAAQGASSVTLNATSGQTLLAGDMIGVGGLLLQVQIDCISVAGVMAVPVVNRLRKSISAGAAVTWSQPTALFRLVSKEAPNYVPGYSESVSLDFVEKI